MLGYRSGLGFSGSQGSSKLDRDQSLFVDMEYKSTKIGKVKVYRPLTHTRLCYHTILVPVSAAELLDGCNRSPLLV